jgi:hypothetical protein
VTLTAFAVIAALIFLGVIAVLIPGGVFVAPILLVALIAYGIYRYTQARRGVV